jgi:hypothetical protein
MPASDVGEHQRDVSLSRTAPHRLLGASHSTTRKSVPSQQGGRELAQIRTSSDDQRDQPSSGKLAPCHPLGRTRLADAPARADPAAERTAPVNIVCGPLHK